LLRGVTPKTNYGWRVTVNGKVVTELGTKADPEKDHIKVARKLYQPNAGETRAGPRAAE